MNSYTIGAIGKRDVEVEKTRLSQEYTKVFDSLKAKALDCIEKGIEIKMDVKTTIDHEPLQWNEYGPPVDFLWRGETCQLTIRIGKTGDFQFKRRKRKS